MKTRNAVDEGVGAALVLLRLASAAADAFPPLKSAAGAALFIADIVSKFSTNKQDWVALADHVVAAIACVIESLPESREPRADLHRSIEKLADAMHHIQQQIRSAQQGSNFKRAWTFVKDPEMILAMRKELDDAIALFHLRASIVTGLDAAKILENVNPEQLFERVTRTLSETIVSTINLNAIPLAEGASWDPSPNSSCLPNTRVALIEEIMGWIESDDHDHTPPVLWLTSVAGGGKSAVANTVAKLCHDKGLLASSFFFDRKTAGRNEPKKLFSTLARGLARYSPECATRLNDVIEADQSVATAPIFRQFKELIHGPTARYSGNKPITFVVDALDEGLTVDLLQILRDEFPHLRRVFRVFVTSRPEPQIVSFFSNQQHIRRLTIDIHGHSNADDIALYAARELKEVAVQRSLPADWPGAELLAEFIAKAGGLFIWVSAVTRYLSRISYPQKKLAALLSGSSNRAMTAEAQMDAIYSSILESCDWEDEDFVEGYRLIMGAITAAKTPLSIDALQSLYRDEEIQVDEILRPISSLITSDVNDVLQPVQFLHLSLQEFLSSRAQLFTKFYLGNIEHSQRLAYLCLVILNSDLHIEIPGTGFLQWDTPESELPGIPALNPDDIPEVLWYACRFWMDHIMDVDAPDEDLVDELQTFLSTQLARWLEILTGRGHFQNLERVQEWIDRTISNQSNAPVVRPENDTSALFHMLSNRLTYMDRRDDALSSIEQAVSLSRQLSVDHPAALARSLSALSRCLTNVGRREKALEADEEAVALFYQLVEESPTAFSRGLANALENRSVSLAELGRREDALEGVKEAIALLRQLATDRPATFNSSLSNNLYNLSLYLSALDRQEDALEAIQQSVALRRQLAEERPATFNPDLAVSLQNLSFCLSNLNRREDALDAIQEAVELLRQSATDRPATFNPSLAQSLYSFSLCLSDFDRREDALEANEQALVLYRQLAQERPATFNSDLALALRNISICLSDLGRREDALDASEKSVALQRQLAADSSVTLNPDFGQSLNNLSHCLTDLGRPEDALEAVEQAVSWYRQLAVDSPATFNCDLASSLDILSECLSNLGRREDALNEIQDAVGLYRQLAAESPETFHPYLGSSLNNLSDRLSDLGRREEALEAIEQALRLQHELAADRPAIFHPDLASSLNSLSTCLSDLGRQEDALDAIESAVALRRELAANRPAKFNPDLAQSLKNLSHRLSELERREDALEAIEQAHVLYRQLADERPAVYNTHLVSSLNFLSTCLTNLGRDEESHKAKEEAEALSL